MVTADRLREVVYEELSGFEPRLFVVQALLALLPPIVGSRLRRYTLHFAGLTIGKGTTLFDVPKIISSGKAFQYLKIGESCFFNVGSTIELGAAVTIGDRVGIGPEVMILTTTHEIGTAEYRCADRYALPVTIENGVWIGARCTILPGVTIGEGAIVAAGALVNKDVPPNTLVAGVPARVVKSLPL